MRCRRCGLLNLYDISDNPAPSCRILLKVFPSFANRQHFRQKTTSGGNPCLPALHGSKSQRVCAVFGGQNSICEMNIAADRKLNFDKLAKNGAIDALAFGFPCNDFSVVGAGIAGTFGGLYSYCVKAVEYYRPKWFFAENVGGLRSADEGNTFNKILQEFAGRGYRIYPHLYK